MPSQRVPIILEEGRRLTFASALEWPGWARSGRGEEAAMVKLGEYRARYAPVAALAGLPLPSVSAFEVIERLPGSSTTDFGAPGAIAEREREGLPGDELERLLKLLDACWRRFDEARAAAPAALRRGPRGGGRDREAIWEHVVDAEAGAYGPKVGVRLSPPRDGDRHALRRHRAALLQGLRDRAARPPEARGWPVRYAIRRVAWHALDHAWEIEDRGQRG